MSGIQDVYMQLIQQYINDIRADAMDFFDAPPVEVKGLTSDECLKLAEEHHVKGMVGAYLYFLAQASLRQQGIVT